MDWKKILKAVLIPTVAILIAAIIYHSFTPIFFTFPLIFLYAGYATVDKHKLDLLSASIVGVLLYILIFIIFSTNLRLSDWISYWISHWMRGESLPSLISFLGFTGNFTIVLSILGGFIAKEGNKLNKHRIAKALIAGFFLVLFTNIIIMLAFSGW